MTFVCLGCRRAFGHKTGLNNHRRVCIRWKNFDTDTIRRRRRLQQQRTPDVNPQEHLGNPSRATEPPGPEQQGPSTIENPMEDDYALPGVTGSRAPPPVPASTTMRSGRSVRLPRQFDDVDRQCEGTVSSQAKGEEGER